MEELISVIVPMYNAEKTIKRCIYSILKQEQVDYEIIIIDDGSTDHSLEICRALEKTYKEIVVYHTKNKGVSHARNFGLEKAKGKWIVFVDADDELVEGALFEAKKMQQEQEADLVCWNMYRIKEGHACLGEKFRVESNIIKNEEIKDLKNALYYIPSKKNRFYGEIIRAPWGKIYLSEIIKKNSIKFPETLSIGEDAIFLFEYLSYCSVVTFIDKPFYMYYEVNNSLVRKYKKNMLKIIKDEAIEIQKVYKKHQENSEKALNNFWQRALVDFIHNEYKAEKFNLHMVMRINNYLKKERVKKYLIKNQKGKFSFLKIWLIKHKCTIVLAFLYTINNCPYERKKVK